MGHVCNTAGFRPKRAGAATFLLLVLLLAIATLGVAGASEESGRWDEAMRAFDEQDRTNPSPPGGVLFVGSSSIRRWRTLATDFPEMVVANRGFGGSTIADSVAWFDQLVLPHRPRLVVFYAGANEICRGVSAETAAADFRAFCDRLHTALPDSKVVFISIVLAPVRWERRAAFALANTYVAAFCAADPRRHFLDVNAAMLTAAGEARPELFTEDRLHLSPAGYALWRDLLKPLLAETMPPAACASLAAR